MRRSHLITALTVTFTFTAVACSSSGSHSTPPTSAGTATTSAPTTITTAPAGSQFYVSLGDSYAAGYQPAPTGEGATTRNGFAYQVPTAAKAKGYSLSLVNFGCSGATIGSMLNALGCKQLGPDGRDYPTQTQAAAAEDFLRANRGHVALVTIEIGGNDVTRCALAADATTCVEGAVQQISTGLATLTSDIRTAAGPDVTIIGLTYPDVLLGAYVLGDANTKQLATLSVTAFKALINPALAKAYSAVGATFVDVTAATGAYGSLTETTTHAPYGTVPVPVAKVCELTYFCDRHDIHPKTEGYTVISNLVVQALPPR